jgi:hypothetical protein
MAKFDVKVSVIDPGGFKSNIGKNIYNRLKAGDMDFSDSLYKEEWENNWVLAGGDLSGMKGPEDIVATTERALFDNSPQRRYMVVGDPDRAERTMRALLRRMLELNQDQPYSYDRAGLVELLDEEMAGLQQ